MELFMIKTGFYEIATKKAAERLADSKEEERRRRDRIAQLNIKFDDDK